MRKRRVPVFAAALLMFCSILTQSVWAFNNYKINVDALKELTATDTFDLKVTKKVVMDDVDSSFGGPHDMLVLTVENSSGVKAESLKVMIVCYDTEQYAQQLVLPSGIQQVRGHEKRQFTLQEFAVENLQAQSITLNIPCSHSSFTGAQALVASYTADGEEVMNPLAEEWNELALGSPTHILD